MIFQQILITYDNSNHMRSKRSQSKNSAYNHDSQHDSKKDCSRARGHQVSSRRTRMPSPTYKRTRSKLHRWLETKSNRFHPYLPLPKKKKTFDLTLHPPRWHAIYSKVSRARIRERKREKEEDEGDMALLPGRPTRPEIRNSRSFLLRDWSFGQRGFRLRDSLRTYYPLYKSIPTYI